MNILKPKRPVLTGIISALMISSLVIGGFYLSPYIYSIFNPYDFRDEVQLPENIKNSFSTYELQYYNYTPSIIPTPIASVLTNVDLQGLEDEIDETMIQQLEKYGFTIVDGGIEDIYYPMDYDFNLETPMYVSTDLCLHTLHSIFDNCLRAMELNYFYGNFSLMAEALRNDQIDLYTINFDTNIKESLKYNIAYLTVLMYMLDNSTSIPSYVYSLVSEELENIEQGERAFSPIFEYEEDFSQYKVRGHYTRNDAFKRYFKAMMYAGRMGFMVSDQTTNNTLGIKQTRMALSLVYSFSIDIDDKTVWDHWDSICRTTNFLVGGSDDLTPSDYFSVWEQQGNLEFSELIDDAFIDEIIDSLKELRTSKINSRYVASFEGQENATKGFRLFGQSYTPDAYIFQELVFDNLANRLFPKALDIFSVFGSERAEYHLASEKEFEGYEEKIVELRNEFSNLSVSYWTQNVYWQWLFSLLPLLEVKEEGYPGYMQSDAWTDKSLMTSLASWVELKHDTILYSKQAVCASGMSDLIYHYVEPYPQVYSRISATAKMLKEGLQARGVLYEGNSESNYEQIRSNFTRKFDEMINIFDTLAEISIKELENKELTSQELKFIHHVGKDLLYISLITTANGDDFTSEADKRTALIADVFTDPNTNQVLEVAVGNPFLIYVIVQDHAGQLYLTRGVTLSYYEFKQPYNERLTDEEWQFMLDSSPPDFPEWISENIPLNTIKGISPIKVFAIYVNRTRME